MLQWKDMFPLNLFSLSAATSFKISIVSSGFISISFALPASAEISKLKLYSHSCLTSASATKKLPLSVLA